MRIITDFWKDEEAIGVVEIILILVVLVALVLLFKGKITEIIDNAFEAFEKDSGDIID